MGQRSINDFNQDLAYSLQASTASFWDRVYQKACVDLSHTELCTDLFWQKQGVDRVVHLTSGRKLHVDEKCRRRVYSDILLETVSNDATGAPGWIEKDLNIDYLAYAFMPVARVYLFPWDMLRRAWRHFGKQWQQQYGTVEAYNVGYTTYSVPVPIKVLRSAVQRATIIQLEQRALA